MSPESPTDNAPSRVCSCLSLQAVTSPVTQHWERITVVGGKYKQVSKKVKINTRNLRWDTSSLVKSSSSHPLSIVTNFKNISNLFQRKGNLRLAENTSHHHPAKQQDPTEHYFGYRTQQFVETIRQSFSWEHGSYTSVESVLQVQLIPRNPIKPIEKLH